MAVPLLSLSVQERDWLMLAASVGMAVLLFVLLRAGLRHVAGATGRVRARWRWAMLAVAAVAEIALAGFLMLR